MNHAPTLNKEAVVVVATVNEYKTIEQILKRSPYPVLLIDGESTDGTRDIAANYPLSRVRYVSRPRAGVADAYRFGFHLALNRNLYGRVSYIIQMDAGGTHDPCDIKRLLDACKQPYCWLATGSRFGRRPSRVTYRTLISVGAAWLMHHLFGVKVRDATCGFRCWRRDLLRKVMVNHRPLSKGHAFQAETLLHAWRYSQGKVREVPIDYHLGINSTFHWPMVWEGLRTIFTLWLDNRRRRI